MVHAFEVQDARGLAATARRHEDEVRAKEAAGRAAMDLLRPWLERAGAAGVPAKAVVREAVPANLILETAQEEGVRLVVVGTHGRRGLGRAVLGSVAETVLRRSRVPVLVAHRG